MNITRKRRLFAGAIAASLVFAACGDDDSDDEESASTEEADGEDTESEDTEAEAEETTEETAGEEETEETDGGEDGETAMECSGSIDGSGASFPDVFYQEAIMAFGDVQPDLGVTYNALGSSTGKQEFGDGINDFAGTDSLVGEGDGPEEGSYQYIPTTAASITVAYNLPAVEELQLSPDLIAQIFQAQVTNWSDEAIAAENPDVELPDQEIIIARRSDGSGTTGNFTLFLDEASDVWELGEGDTVEWPGSSQGGQQNTGVAQIVTENEGAIGYIDLGDALQLDLQTAAVQNAEGNYVEPSVEATTAALAGAELNDDLSYNPLNGPGADAYPITAPTFILVRTDQDPETAANVKCFVEWLVTDGGDYAADVGFAPLPEELQEQAVAALDETLG